MNKRKIAAELVKLAKDLVADIPMAVFEVTPRQLLDTHRKIENQSDLRDAELLDDWYGAYSDDRSNKYFYVAVYDDTFSSGDYVTVSAWGRIGYARTGKTKELYRGPDKFAAEAAAKSKIRAKGKYSKVPRMPRGF